MKIRVRDLAQKTAEFAEKKVMLSGWIRTNRDQSHFGFIQLTDGTFFTPVQVVYHNTLSNFAEVSKLGVASAVEISGIVRLTPEGKQSFEIQAEEISIISRASADYPLQPKRHTREYLREIAHFRPRANLFQAVFRVRSLAAHAIHSFFQEQDFVYVHTPIITGTDGEGAGEMFTVTTQNLDAVLKTEENTVDYSKDFFGKKAGLAVTGQLEGEIFALAFSNIYTFGPTFRAENSNTTRHASEFWMIEPEIAFADLELTMDLAESMVKYIVKYVWEKAPEEMAFFNQFVDKTLRARMDVLMETDFPRITYTDAIQILQDSGKAFENKVEWGIDLSTEHERYLTDEVYKKPLFITDYPVDIKAFYMRVNDDNRTVSAADLLVPGVGELIGGSAREERIDKLEAKMDVFGIDKESMWWYLDINRYGGVKHAGFGMGFERMIMYLTGMDNIRDVIPFPRTPKNLEF
ncbi:asparaginyl tRNA synthetase [Erysipelotrichaceae bacterium]|nr:asparaginyl tRNA synthetase [Erysipelotrichaceae bacterium]